MAVFKGEIEHMCGGEGEAPMWSKLFKQDQSSKEGKLQRALAVCLSLEELFASVRSEREVSLYLHFAVTMQPAR